MQLNLLNLLQQLLLPIALGAVVVAGLLVLLAARKPGQQQRRPPATRAPQGAAGTARPQAGAVAAKPPRPPARPAPAPAPAATAPQGAPGPATTVHAAQPAAAAAPEAPAAAQSPGSASAPRPRLADLLLVDDSAVVRAKLRRLFEPAGYSMALAPDGEAARTLLGQGRYGLLLTDLEMPRLDGVGLIRATQADPGCAGMPILAITGHDDLQSQLNQLQAVAGIYRKPWVDDDLLHHVQSLVAPSLLPAETEHA